MSTRLAETRAETRRETGGTLAGRGGTSTYSRGLGVSANRHPPLGGRFGGNSSRRWRRVEEMVEELP
jgi:hypothetical protein